jgi:hypothetical protein
MFLHGEAKATYKWLNGWRFDTIAVVPPVMFVVWLLARVFDPDALSGIFAALVGLSPILLPVGLFVVFWKRWIHYIRFQYWFKQPMVLLHIELPPEVEKSPAAMELLLTGLHNSGGEGTFIQRIWKGQFMPVASLELVGEAGRISYYLQVRRFWKDFTEARIYGQFPEARVTEVEDYVSAVRFTPETHAMWGTEFKKGDIGAVPIKTYIDWELDKNPDTPETKVDPLTNIFELMNTLKPGERIWIQIIIKARKGDEWYGFYSETGGKRFQTEGAKKIEELTKAAIKRAQDIIGAGKKEAQERAAERGTGQLTQGERDVVAAIERSMNKLVFDCGIRALYLTDNGAFNPSRIGQVATLWAPFKNRFQGLNPTRGLSIFDYPWQDWDDIRNRMIKKQIFFWYKHRAFFYVPLDQDSFMMTTEELASLWHFPGSQVKTPALQRVPSRVSEAPLNLPVAQGPLNLLQ